jgi:hypothetical protein
MAPGFAEDSVGSRSATLQTQLRGVWKPSLGMRPSATALSRRPPRLRRLYRLPRSRARLRRSRRLRLCPLLPRRCRQHLSRRLLRLRCLYRLPRSRRRLRRSHRLRASRLRSCPAGAHGSTCPGACLGSGACTGFLRAEGDCCRASRVCLRPLLPRRCSRQRRPPRLRCQYRLPRSRRRFTRSWLPPMGGGERIHPRRLRSLHTARHAPQ